MTDLVRFMNAQPNSRIDFAFGHRMRPFLLNCNPQTQLDEPKKNGTHKNFCALKMSNICQQNVSKQL